MGKVPRGSWSVLSITTSLVVLALLGWLGLPGTYWLESRDLRFALLHNVVEESVPGSFAATGPDPFLEVVFPWRHRALHHLELVLDTPDIRERYLFYFVPAIHPKGEFQEPNHGWAQAEVTESGLVRLDIAFPAAVSRFRFSLPSEGQVRFVSAEVKSSFFPSVDFGGIGFLLLTLGLPVGGVFILAFQMRSFRPWLPWGIAAVMVAVKLWYVASLPVYALGTAEHDDYLQVRQAVSLLQGEWLGAYDHLVMTKRPMYPFWLALTGLSGMPVFLAQHLLWLLAIVMCLWAWRSLHGVSSWWLLAAFAVLWWNPILADFQQLRLYRLSLQPVLTLWLAASLLAWFGTRHRPAKHAVAAILLGTVLAANLLNREESVWVYPVLALVFLVGMIDSILREGRRSWRVCLLVPLPLLVGHAALVGVAWKNLVHYGVWTTSEIHEPNFQKAIGYLQSLQGPDTARRLSLHPALWEEVAAVSPSFAELLPYLQSQSGVDWARHSFAATGRPPEERWIAPGWFLWAIRAAAEQQGWHDSAPIARERYRLLAKEVEHAVASGYLESTGLRATLRPMWDWQYLPLLRQAWWQSFFLLPDFSRQFARPLPSHGPEAVVEVFARMAHTRPATHGMLTEPDRWLDLRWRALRVAALPYERTGGWWLLAFASAALLLRGWQAWRSSRIPASLFLPFAWLGGWFGFCLIIALVDVLAFPAVFLIYLAPANVLFLVFCLDSILPVTTRGRNHDS